MAVAVLLAASLIQQFRVLGPRGALLDGLALVPQWKFFGQSRIGTDPACMDDLHLIARVSRDTQDLGPWLNLLWWEDRPLINAVWNPASRSRDAIGVAMVRLVVAESADQCPASPTALIYLTVLRHCLDLVPLAPGDALQFALVTTRGRAARPATLGFLSGWHTP